MNWYQEDKLWEKFYDCMFDEKSFEQAKIQARELIELVDHPVYSILDLGCGPGRHSLALTQMGYTVDGIDSSQYLLSKAVEKARQLKCDTNFLLLDMLGYSAHKSSDLIINMFNSFGYFDNQDKNQSFVDQCYENLKDTGTFIIDTVGKETLARTIQPVHLTEYSNGDLRIERPLLIDNMQIFSNEWLLIQGDQVFRRNYQHYVYTPMELSTMCYDAGFSHVEVYGSLAGEEYDLESDRLIIVAEKY